LFFFFFFQAEDGIRDKLVTGVQTCALPIYTRTTSLTSTSVSSSSIGAPVIGNKECKSSATPCDELEIPNLRVISFSSATTSWPRSEERRVGKECRSRRAPEQ